MINRDILVAGFSAPEVYRRRHHENVILSIVMNAEKGEIANAQHESKHSLAENYVAPSSDLQQTKVPMVRKRYGSVSCGSVVKLMFETIDVTLTLT